MVASSNLAPGMTISINGKLFRVESCLKVTVPKGTPFIKAKLRDLSTNGIVEKSFKLDQQIKDVSLAERRLEFLYPEDAGYLFLDIGNLEQVNIPEEVVGNKMNFLKEGVEVKASFYGDSIFAVELPQYLELMIAKIEGESGGNRRAVLETGAKILVPQFVDAGDIVKVDTVTEEYIQRV
jgi:elongation factor P